MRVKPNDAILVIDVFSTFDFEGAESLLPWARRMATRLRPVLDRARQIEIPVIFANDNLQNFRLSFEDVLRKCSHARARGARVARLLRPRRNDFTMLKPKHSAFFETCLRSLLEAERVKRLLLCGVATNLCVTFTAHDAHMQGYQTVVISDCCAAERDEDHDFTLTQLKQFCRTKICRSDELQFCPKSS